MGGGSCQYNHGCTGTTVGMYCRYVPISPPTETRVVRLYHRGRTYIESDRMTSSAPMESADQAARPGGRVSKTMVVLCDIFAFGTSSAERLRDLDLSIDKTL